MGKYEGLIGIAGALGLISFSSLLLKIFETHNTTSLPWSWILINLVAQTLSVIYGVANNSYGIYVPCIVFVVGLLYIFYVKMKHPEHEKSKEL
jgi:O-antigen/teichoic acid export membrane protein